MKEDQNAPDNINLLLAKLKPDTLATALTTAWKTPGEATPQDAMASILAARIAQVREALDEPAD